jgi:hypothetical protein
MQDKHMGMTPDEFLESFVEGNRSDCREAPGDVRRAFNAAVSASHLADQYFNYCERHNPKAVSAFGNLGAFVSHLRLRTNGAFTDIRSVSNAYKHLYTDVGRLSQHSSVSSCGSIESIELPGDENLRGLEEDYDRGGGPDGRVCVVLTRKDGSRAEFLPLLDTVVDCLRKLVYADS